MNNINLDQLNIEYLDRLWCWVLDSRKCNHFQKKYFVFNNDWLVFETVFFHNLKFSC